MNKKIIGIIIIVAILAISAIAYTWYNAQFDENLTKASGYQTLALKNINEDINDVMKETSLDRDTLKAKLPGIKNALNESISANENITTYLNNAKNFAKNDVEKEYIDLLLKKNELNKKINEYQQKRFSVIEKYVNGDLSLSESNNQLIEINNDNEHISIEAEDVNNKIIKLLTENPDFKKHLKSLNLDKTYFGENPDN